MITRALPLFLLLTPAIAAAKPTKLSWVYTNIQEGYDHQNRMDVYVDDKKIAESTVTMESQKNSLTFEIPAGANSLRIVNMALYEGNWEEHTIENNYSIDCLYEAPVPRKGFKKIDIVCDIDAGPSIKAK